jgi:hypothetical protein
LPSDIDPQLLELVQKVEKSRIGATQGDEDHPGDRNEPSLSKAPASESRPEHQGSNEDNSERRVEESTSDTITDKAEPENGKSHGGSLGLDPYSIGRSVVVRRLGEL